MKEKYVMKVLNYSDWKETHNTLQMVLQMMGKTKLDKMPAQPEWYHTLLDVTTSGFTTGLIPSVNKSFVVTLDLRAKTVRAECTDGYSSEFSLRDGASVADYYQDYNKILNDIGTPTEINPVPQEVPTTTPFDEQYDKVDFDFDSALTYFESCIFARNALLEFSSPYRGKKIQPMLFWGTFDTTTVLFSGREKPFPGEGIIEKVAFDEKFVEFGYWPGDDNVDEPMFFVLAYPFLDKDLRELKVDGSYWGSEKKEYFLSLKDALDSDDPQKKVRLFCEEAFSIIAKETNWTEYDWYVKPLLID